MLRPIAPRVAGVSALVLVLAFLIAGLTGGCSDPGKTPKSAAKALLKAMEEGDTATARTVATDTEEELQALDALAGNISAAVKLWEAVKDRFGDEAADLGKENPLRGLAADLHKMEGKIDGDTAKLVKPGEAGGGLKLKRVDGSWKVDIGSMGVEFGRRRGLGQKVAEARRKAMGVVAEEVEDGKYETAEAAEKALAEKTLDGIAGASDQ